MIYPLTTAMDGVRIRSKSLRLALNLAFMTMLYFFLFNQNKFTPPLYLRRKSSKSSYRWSSQASRSGSVYEKKNPAVSGPNLSLKLRILAEKNISAIGDGGARATVEEVRDLAESPNVVVPAVEDKDDAVPCSGVKRHLNYDNECEYIKAQDDCSAGGFIEYVEFFYCSCGKVHILGYIVLGLWLVALFYMLGNTAADYFCCSLEMLSSLLKLPPTVAGVTLLPLGNGAPDVFASIAAFGGADAGEVGLNSVLGGAVFVTCVVAGSISLFVAGSGVSIDQECFVRDVGFFLLTLASLCVILILGKISLWGALGFVSIYFVYATTIAAKEILRKRRQKFNLESITILHPVGGDNFGPCVEDDSSIRQPLLDPVSATGLADDSELKPLPQWMWDSNVAIYTNHGLEKSEESARTLWGWSEEEEKCRVSKVCLRWLLFLLELPLLLPRRLTIPIVDENRWSRGFAIASVALAPILMAALWNSQEIKPFGIGKSAYVIAGILGATLGTLAFFTTKAEHPPRRFVFPWVAGGFLMSILWFYMIANELVALLVAFGTILDISPSLLGLTVLAWGNSMGDLMSNIALALNGGDGVQIAMSGCYAGPMFNTLAGLGLSLVLGAWKNEPFYIIPEDVTLFYTLGFLVAGLLWTLVVLPSNNMYPSKLLGIGLLMLYLLFLLFRLGKYLEAET
uniref:TSA: Wollemia nobilis Ref_Wollemi_Transcript_4307_3223 transcribed RNA sequence n=1 Tax=Wollemia nobilis TaxID=56998 RepID=A0A0C9S8J3_9CONI